MGSVTSSTTPLLNAFRRPRSPAIQGTGLEPWFQSFLTLCGCLIPIAVCWYLGSPCRDFTVLSPCLAPLFSYQDVEFTHPDVVVGVVVLAVLARCLVKGFHPLPKALVIPFALFFISTMLSTLFAIDKVHGIAALIQELEFIAIAWAFPLLTQPRTFLRIVHVILVFFIFQSLVAAWQFIVLDDWFPTGTFAVHQQYAFFTSFAAVMAFALVANATGAKKQRYLIALAILLMGSLLGQERAPWLSFLIGAVAVVWYSGKKKRKRLILYCGATALGAIILVATVPKLRDVTISRFSEAQSDTANQNSLLSRLVLWKVASDLFLQNPILGIGPKNFQMVVSHYASLGEMQGYSKIDPHNVWIGTLAEQGIVGFVTYLVLCIAVFKLATTHLRKASLTGLPRSLCLVYVAYFFFWLTMSYPFFQKGAGHIDFLLIGLMIGLGQSISAQTAFPSRELGSR